ncbi:MAG: aldo/keto reductase [Anaerolineales bacterium]
MSNPTLPLTKDITIPQMGFGTWELSGHGATEAILHALQTGYRHMDTADIYRTHGNIAEAIPRSSVPPLDIFITTKLWSHSLSAHRVGPAVDRFLKELGIEHIDLLLIHWPGNTPVAETLGAMDQARQAGKVRALGVSNFGVELMQESLDTGFPVVNNQIEYNLNHRPDDVVAFCLSHQVTVTAYSPLEHGNSTQEKTLAELANKYSVTREQVLLNWLLRKGMIVIPRSSDPAHIESNFHTLAWTLAAEDSRQLDEA